MDIRPPFFVLGLALLIGSLWWGNAVIWLGAPLLLLAIVFWFIDVE